jgi:hypothetical protein
MLLQTKSTAYAPQTPTTVKPSTPVTDIAVQLGSPVLTPPTVGNDRQPVPPGLAPEATKGSQFRYGEATLVSVAKSSVIEFDIDSTLRNRKVYGLIMSNPSNATDYAAYVDIEFYRENSKIGVLPLNDAISGAAAGIITESVPSIFVAATPGSITPDLIQLNIALPVNGQPSAVVIAPQCLVISADFVRVNVRRLLNITGIRLWLGIISSESY